MTTFSMTTYLMTWYKVTSSVLRDWSNIYVVEFCIWMEPYLSVGTIWQGKCQKVHSVQYASTLLKVSELVWKKLAQCRSHKAETKYSLLKWSFCLLSRYHAVWYQLKSYKSVWIWSFCHEGKVNSLEKHYMYCTVQGTRRTRPSQPWLREGEKENEMERKNWAVFIWHLARHTEPHQDKQQSKPNQTVKTDCVKTKKKATTTKCQHNLHLRDNNTNRIFRQSKSQSIKIITTSHLTTRTTSSQTLVAWCHNQSPRLWHHCLVGPPAPKVWHDLTLVGVHCSQNQCQVAFMLAMQA